jgi:hypothetical protein
MHNGIDFARVFFEQLHHGSGIADVDAVMFVTANTFDQILPRFLGGRFRTEKLRTHVIIDPDHARAICCESFYCLRTDQSG